MYLWQIIRPDLLAPVCGADEITTHGSTFSLFFGKLHVHKAGGEDLVGAATVLKTRIDKEW